MMSSGKFWLILFLSVLLGTVGSGASDAENERTAFQAIQNGDMDGTSSATKSSSQPLPNPVKPEVIRNGRSDKNKIALTFDACSTRGIGEYDERISDVLLRMGVKATIFLGGKWAEEEREHVAMLAGNRLFELGSHAYLHPHLAKLSDSQIRKELLRAQQAIAPLIGRQATLFRPPYGEYDERVVRIAAEMGLTTIEYDLPSGDPDKHATKEKLIEYVTAKAKNGSIIVMHINRRGWHTAEALPDIIEALRGKGFELVTVGELLEDLRAGGAK